MLVFQGNEFRNLEEQVQKNKEDIARHYEIDRAMANLGINIVGQVETEADLPSAATYAGNYGDTYAVGNKAEVEAGTASYSYYVWVGPDLNAEEPNDHWLNVGRISIVGPQGERGLQGERGPQGERGTSISAGASGNYYGTVNGDLYLVTSGTASSLGNVYVYSAKAGQWVLQGNIRGPQGPQGVQGPPGERGLQGAPGPKGETGDVGGFINIAGIVATSDSLPLPSELGNLTVAYLVGASAPYDLYVQVGSTSEGAVWVNAGPFNAATLVTVNGVGQNVWDAGTKVDKPDIPTAGNAVVIMQKGTGTSSTVPIEDSSEARPNWIIKYLDGRFFGDSAPSGTGTIIVPEPKKSYQSANKKYVDDNKGTKLYEHEITGVSGTATTGDTITNLILVSTSSASITGGGETALSILYLDSINSYIPDSGKITYILDLRSNQVTVQFHNRLNGGEVESMILNVENMVDTVTAL